MPDIEFTINPDEVKRIIARIKHLSPKRQAGIFVQAFRALSRSTADELKLNVSNKILKVRNAFLRSSIGWRVEQTNRGLSAVIGSGIHNAKGRVPYANILERGGTITAKGKYLAIPLRAALTRAGASKMPSPRDFKSTFVQRSKKGNLIIFQALGKTPTGRKRLKGYIGAGGEKIKSNIVPLFVLKKSVNIPPKKYMAITLAQMKPRIFQIMNATVSRELSK